MQYAKKGPFCQCTLRAPSKFLWRIRAVWPESSLIVCAIYSIQAIQRGINENSLPYWMDVQADLKTGSESLLVTQVSMYVFFFSWAGYYVIITMHTSQQYTDLIWVNLYLFIWGIDLDLRCTETLGRFSAIFDQGDNFYDFAFLQT